MAGNNTIVSKDRSEISRLATSTTAGRPTSVLLPSKRESEPYIKNSLLSRASMGDKNPGDFLIRRVRIGKVSFRLFSRNPKHSFGSDSPLPWWILGKPPLRKRPQRFYGELELGQGGSLRARPVTETPSRISKCRRSHRMRTSAFHQSFLNYGNFGGRTRSHKMCGARYMDRALPAHATLIPSF